MIRKGSVLRLSKAGLKKWPHGKGLFFQVVETFRPGETRKGDWIIGERPVRRRLVTKELLGDSVWILTPSEAIRVNNPRTLRWARAQQRRRS